ncbi:hypothetical protein [Paracoccus sp. 22332]|uniref:hypothetical protein n=1 Tax=Paracoccus sp. 22332 TaxID=3453913 RepID=UPI003F830B05
MPMGVEAVRSALIAGDCIMVTQIAEPESKAGTYYALRQSGKTVTKSAFAKLRPDLVPVDPGLFADAPQAFAIIRRKS